MFARNEADFSIMKNNKGYLISIGTWSNYNQSFADCLLYLTLRTGTNLDRFNKHLQEYNNLFLENKKEIINDIRKNEINYNSIINTYQLEYQIEGLIDGNEEYENYILDEGKLDKYIIKNHIKEIINILSKAKDIKEAHKDLQILKSNIEKEIVDNVYEFLSEINQEDDKNEKTSNN